jgi:hypothetical protein
VPADREAENGPGLNGSSTRLIFQKPGFWEKPGVFARRVALHSVAANAGDAGLFERTNERAGTSLLYLPILFAIGRS